MQSLLWIIVGLIQFSLELEINITRFDNCLPGLGNDEGWPIEIQEVHYIYNDVGFIDSMHGTYIVKSSDEREKELTIIVYKCSTDDPQPCERKVEYIITDLHCDKFRNDDSGIWHMVSQAMTGSICGVEMGVFKFDIPRVNPEYFEKYLQGDEQSSRYRIVLLFHKKSEYTKDERACVDIHFDVYR